MRVASSNGAESKTSTLDWTNLQVSLIKDWQMNCLYRLRVSNSDTSFLRLKAAETRYRGMFENAIEGIYQSTPDGHYLVVNSALAKMYGYERPEELLNQVSDIQSQVYVDSSFRERFKQQMEQNGFVVGLEYQVRRRDGSIIWITESARAVRDEAGAIHHYEGFIDNITGRKNAEAERAKLEKQMLHAQKMEAIGTLAGGMAHDFNNILCAILGYTELALGDAHVRGRTRENLDMVLKSANRARDLIKRILTFSRPTDAQHHPLKLGLILKEVLKLLSATLPSSISIHASIRTDNDVVVADATEMHQVIMNLGTNAGHAMKAKGGRLEFELETLELDAGPAQTLSLPAGSYVHLIVSDTGRGMSPEVLERIFEPFFTTKAPGRGTGLGLTLVQKIVNRSGGHIRVNSHVGEGTTFHLYLPESKEPPAANPADKNEIMRGQQEQILVVDDEIPVLDMMQQRLRKMGYRVTTRADSREAMKTFRADSNKFDLVITDHTMPDLQGAELAEEMSAVRPNLPIILMTGLNQPPDLSRSRYAPLRFVFQKPIDFIELSHCMRRFLDHEGQRATSIMFKLP
jgi:two-component system cell cycle sensor histidine kinase/response regulator CckA